MKQEDMKKFEYRLEAYQFKVDNDIVSNIEKTFRKEGLNGWELVQWEGAQGTIGGLRSLCDLTADTMSIIATWKREVEQ